MQHKMECSISVPATARKVYIVAWECAFMPLETHTCTKTEKFFVSVTHLNRLVTHVEHRLIHYWYPSLMLNCAQTHLIRLTHYCISQC